MHPLPDAPRAPAGEAFVDTVPVAVALWEQPPLGAAATHPQHGIEKLTAVGFLSNVQVGTRAQEGKKFWPLVVTEFNCCHTYQYHSNVNTA